MSRERTVHERRPALIELQPALRDRILALDEPVAWDDWQDVLRRVPGSAPRSRRRRGIRALAVAGVLAVGIAVAGPALGLRLSSLVDFGSSSRAPAPVRDDFASMDRGAPEGLAPGAIASETRLVETVRLRDGSHSLYVSPTRQGGFCYLWTDLAGGCDQFGTTPVNISWGGDRLNGTVASAYVASVEIVFTDGATAVPEIAWVSAPIDAGFFLFEAPAGKTVDRVDGYDAGGRLVASQGLLGQPYDSSAPPRFALTDHEVVALTVETPDGTATAYTGPSTTDGKCAWLELAATYKPLYGWGGCMPHGYPPHGWVAGFVRIGSSVLLAGRAAPTYARVTLTLPGGGVATITPTRDDGLILYSLPAAATSAKVTITAYRADGRVIFSSETSAAPAVPRTLGPLQSIP